MSTQPSHLRSVTPSDGNGGESAGRQHPRAHPAKALPSDRMKMDKQIAVLQAIGRHSSPRRHIDAEGLSRVLTGTIAPTTVILSNRFFEAAGWITTPDKGRYAATDALVEYTRRLSVGTPDPEEVLREPVRRSWFWQVLEPDLVHGQRLSLNDAHFKLMDEAEASDGHLPNIRNLIAWLEYVGMIIVRDQGIVAKNAGSVGSAPPEESPNGQQDRVTPPRLDGGDAVKQGGDEPPATVVAFSFDVKVTTDDLERLSADQIKALFEAVGTVMAIKQKS